MLWRKRVLTRKVDEHLSDGLKDHASCRVERPEGIINTTAATRGSSSVISKSENVYALGFQPLFEWRRCCADLNILVLCTRGKAPTLGTVTGRKMACGNAACGMWSCPCHAACVQGPIYLILNKHRVHDREIAECEESIGKMVNFPDLFHIHETGSRAHMSKKDPIVIQ